MARLGKGEIRYSGYIGQKLNVTLLQRDKDRRVPSPLFGEYTTSWMRRIGAREAVHPQRRIGVPVPPGVTEVYVLDKADGQLVVGDGKFFPPTIYRTFWVIAQDIPGLVKAFGS